MQFPRIIVSALCHCFLLSATAGASAEAGPSDPSKPVEFNSQIRPILTRSCSSCHGGVKQAGDVSFVYAEQVLPPDGWVIEPGDPESSILIERITSDDPEMRMPPPDEHPEPLPTEEIELLRRWIAEGARWGDHWSLAPLQDVSLGGVPNQKAWPRFPMDRYVLSTLRENGLEPSAEATPAEWFRRVNFDLIGLPPTDGQTRQFLQRYENASTGHDRDAVYARTVDRLLQNTHFGERWAAMWMDLARYADSKGFEKDPHRDMWPYRDWLIDAFNRDMPYDEFTIKQLAGDLLAAPAAEEMIATAFHRNTQTNTEGGTDDEEFRVAAVIDRINTTWTVWQATTFGCVQCHSHPYDAYRQPEYYACMSLFNNSLDGDLDDDFPTLRIPHDPSRRGDAVAAQLKYEAIRNQRNRLGSELATATDWRPLTPSSAQTTGGKLKIVGNHVFADGGTFPVGVTYTVEAAAAAFTALRIEILPQSADSKDWPEQGSLLTQVELKLLKSDAAAQQVELAEVFTDHLTSDHDPRDCLNKNNRGVGGYPKLFGPRWAVFVPKRPLAPDQGDKIQLTMVQSGQVTGQLATPIRHFTWSSDNDRRWSDLLLSQQLTDASQRLSKAKKAAAEFQGAALPVMRPRDTAVARPTRLFVRGNWLDHGEEIPPGIPGVFAKQHDGRVIDVQNRLELAKWLVSDDNPLAARVWANRIWAQLFGIGIVETLEDFGSSGQQPTHPELLDHLALRVRDHHDWHLKPLLREIVLSSTYRQSHRASQVSRVRDPKNRLFTRGPRTRLSAEMVRDQALLVAGLLTQRVGGPSVMPPQPEGVWQAVYSGTKWETATGPERYRRALYTYWRRTSPYPSFLTFDAPTRDVCSARRIATNTPLQALVTLNDPVYVECAKALAQRAASAPRNTTASTIDWMVTAVTQRHPTRLESRELSDLYQDLRASQDTDSLANTTRNPNPESPDGIDLDALTIVANTILNLDNALTK